MPPAVVFASTSGASASKPAAIVVGDAEVVPHRVHGIEVGGVGDERQVARILVDRDVAVGLQPAAQAVAVGAGGAARRR